MFNLFTLHGTHFQRTYPHLVILQSSTPAILPVAPVINAIVDSSTEVKCCKTFALSGPCSAMSPRSSRNSRLTSFPFLI